MTYFRIAKKPIHERFWKRVKKTDGCWLWTGHVGKHGYGQITINESSCTVHRVSWRLHFGFIPEGMCVCHHCDTRLCIKPDHLFLGTVQDNIADMVKKGRSKIVKTSNRRVQYKLNEQDVNKIRDLLKEGNLYQREIAKMFGVTQTNIGLIKRGKTWKHD